ncbi:MAG: hypothetical protein ACFFD1_04350 [Candidatus Thorarchaeota archaeon]
MTTSPNDTSESLGSHQEEGNEENMEIQNTLERIIEVIQTLLEKNKHGVVFAVFNELVKKDLHLRKKIAHELFPGISEDYEPWYSPDELQEIIVLQSFTNNYRIALLVSITNYIINKYKEASEIVKKDFDKGTIKFKGAQDLDYWYISEIKKNLNRLLKNENDEYREFESQLYDEMLQVLTEVSDTGLETMKKMLKEAITKFRFSPFS